MLKTANTSFMLGTSSWREQFLDALTVSAVEGDDDNGGDEGDEEDESKRSTLSSPAQPGCFDYFMHFLAVPWKLLFASIPPTDTFASKVAAIQDKYADSSIGNCCCNEMNCFALNISGIAWAIAAIYHWFKGDQFRVDPGTLAFSVTIFCIEALICIAVIVLRRHPTVGGELGGPVKYKVLTSGLFVILWFTYLGLSALESYCIIAGF
uniref:Sodium/calcium exchanger membrane region domain-containing protein n=1 Tax=Parascaris equorum TaxID=6256 RepID=A0A914RSN3_PAREQ